MSCIVCPNQSHGKGYRNNCANYNTAYLCTYLGCSFFTSTAVDGCSGYLDVGDLDCPQDYICGPWDGVDPNPNVYDMDGDLARLVGRCIVNGQPVAVTFRKCCEEAYGGTIDYTGCTLPSCCGCDWCCNQPEQCLELRQYQFENLPLPKTTACVSGVCPQIPPRPVCRAAEFVLGKRPSAHEPSCVTPDRPNRTNRHELHSVNPIRAMDLDPVGNNCTAGNECRTYYGHVGRGGTGGTNPPTPSTKTTGFLCGQENRRIASTKRANRCYVSKRPDGRHSFNCAYRSPCPEKPSVCL